MSNPAWLKKYLTMKPEVAKIFNDLEDYLDFCRFELLHFHPADLYNNKNANWKKYVKEVNQRKKRR